MASNNRNANQWLVGIAIAMAIVVMCLTLFNKRFSDRVTGLQPYSEIAVVGVSGKLESVESPTLQREDVRRISELEVLSKAGVRYKCVSAKLGLICRQTNPAKR